MLTKISKIKGLGIFSNYQWDGSLPLFKRYNLFYGWNGSGKTTLTKLFDVLGTGSSEEYISLEYEISSDTTTYRQGEQFGVNVRVFNKDYISNNIERQDGKSKPIFILGEENKKLSEQIESDQKLLDQLKKEYKAENDNKVSKENAKGKVFTDVAKIIGTNTGGLVDRNYRRPDAQSAFAKLTNKEILSADEQEKCKLTLRQEEMDSIVVLSKLEIPKEGEEEAKALNVYLEEIHSTGSNLCAETITSVTIQRLKENSDISDWVEKGISLHAIHDSEKCEYCGQKIPPQRIDDLAKHFNAADKSLKTSIDVLINNLQAATDFIKGINPVDKANLYTDLQQKYKNAVAAFEIEKEKLIDSISSLSAKLATKKQLTTEQQVINEKIDSTAFIEAHRNVNKLIEKHNDKTSNFKTEKDRARDLLEKHYLSEIFDDVISLTGEIENCSIKLNELQNGHEEKGEIFLGITQLTEQIEANRSKISSSHKACNEINERLKTFLGREELVFEVDENEEGYIIKRNGKIANNLSEGEKTAIAFVYFTVHLQDQEFDASSDIVVIDDPISSLDSNSLFQAFAFLKNAVKDVKQVFIFTHNFDFLRLLLNWVQHPENRDMCSKYMIQDVSAVSGDRAAKIAKLDRLLCDHESEYHYLFKILKQFESDGTIASVYNIPNIARKVLDTFLMFRVPKSGSNYNKLQCVPFDDDKKTAIHKFTNDMSHITGKGFDPSLIQETQKNVRYLLEMMEAVFPEHYKILCESIT
ncbi:MAG: AAA family ATPase [Candidatus Peribacteraceae bacterium]|nr:AAA family ATPase [Candidatus Peribacteraceae bacterium]